MGNMNKDCDSPHKDKEETNKGRTKSKDLEKLRLAT